MKIRPITVLAALALVAVVATIVLVDRDRSSDDAVVQPASLPLALGASWGASTTTAVPAMAQLDRVTYVRGPGLADLGGTQSAWVVSGLPDPAAVQRLAAAFGVVGQPVERDGELVVGPPEGRALRVGTSSGAPWSVTDPAELSTGVACAEASPPTTVPPTTQPPSTAPSGTVPNDVPSTDASTGSAAGNGPNVAEPTPLGSSCPVPQPPPGVPDGTTAEAAARHLLADAGIDLASVAVSVTADPWSAVVQVHPVLDGVAVEGLDTTVVFGARGVITSANGWLDLPVRADTYPLIGLDAAIAHLQAGEGQLGIQPMMTTADTPSTMVATSGPSTGDDSPVTTGTAQPGPPSDVSTSTQVAYPPITDPLVTAPTAPVPPATGAPQPPTSETVPTPGPTVVETPDRPVLPQPGEITVTITEATVVLAAVPGTDGSIWLVPAYHLGSADGGAWTVLAVDSAYVTPGAKDLPGRSGSTGGDGSSGGGATTGGGAGMTPGSSAGSTGVEPNTAPEPCGRCDGSTAGVTTCCAPATTTTSGG